MKFIKIYYYLLRNGEFLQLMKNILKVINQFDVNQLKLSKLVNTYASCIQALDEVFKPISGEELTNELKTLDTRRDKALMGVKLFLQCCLYREEESIVNAARSLLDIYESHGKRIDKLPYQQQTAVTNALLKDYEDETETIESLESNILICWLQLIKELNISFDNTYVDRAKTIMQTGGIEEKREAIKTAFDELTGDIAAYARIAENKEAYLPIIPAINGLIEDYNKAAQNRLSGKASADNLAPIAEEN